MPPAGLSSRLRAPAQLRPLLAPLWAALRPAVIDELAERGTGTPRHLLLRVILEPGRRSVHGDSSSGQDGRELIELRMGESPHPAELRHLLAHELAHMIEHQMGLIDINRLSNLLLQEYLAERLAWRLLTRSFASQLVHDRDDIRAEVSAGVRKALTRAKAAAAPHRIDRTDHQLAKDYRATAHNLLRWAVYAAGLEDAAGGGRKSHQPPVLACLRGSGVIGRLRAQAQLALDAREPLNVPQQYVALAQLDLQFERLLAGPLLDELTGGQ